MVRARLITGILAAWIASIAPAGAYYHYLHFLPSGVAVPEKFDLNALSNRTLTFFVSSTDPGSLQYGPNDSLASVISQVREAIDVWNGVGTSDLRLAFGGLASQAVQNTPGGQVAFDDLPPGWLASGDRTVTDAGPNAAFWPITQGVVHLNRNILPAPAGAGPSYLEAYYTTLVHEIGHTLGLQHTYTSSAMSTSVTRSTSRANPLGADDVAGVSVLYGQTSSFGSITGRVTSGGQGVNLASVVAIAQNGPAVSTLSNPDGSYRIDGVPQGTYWVYVHPLPPGADFQYPTDASGQPLPPTGLFETLFYSLGTAGTRDPAQFTALDVARGAVVTGVDFAPQGRDSVPLYDVTMYSYFGQNPVSPAFLNASQSPGTLVAVGTGVLNGGLSAQVLGGSGNIYATAPWQNALAMYLTYPAGAPAGPRHILFTTPSDAYVLPAAFTLVQKQPPAITAVSQNADGTVTVTGTNMGADSRVFFDGIQARVRVAFSGSDQAGSIVVDPPQGASNQTATIVVYNADGQNSTFAQPQSPPVYSYGPSDPGSATVSPAALPAGVNAMVEVNWPNAHFLDNPVAVGFGTSDVSVRRVWVISQTRLVANVAVSSGAVPGASLLNVTCGFQSFSQPFGFQVQPANPRLPAITLPVTNTSGGPLYPGVVASISGVNLAPGGVNPTVTLNDQPVQVLASTPGLVIFMVPGGAPQGWAVLRLHNGMDEAFPVVVPIEAAPPTVVGVNSLGNQPLDAAHPAQIGDVISVQVANVDAGVLGQPARLRVSIGGVEAPALAISPLAGQQKIYQAYVIVPSVAAGAQVALTVRLDGGLASGPFLIAVH